MSDGELRDRIYLTITNSGLSIKACVLLDDALWPVLREALAKAWDAGYMRGQYPWTHESQEVDPIPENMSPPTWGPNANPWREGGSDA